MTVLFCPIQTMSLQDPGSPANAVKETCPLRMAQGDSQKTSLEIQYAVLPIRFARKDVQSIGLEIWTLPSLSASFELTLQFCCSSYKSDSLFALKNWLEA